MKPKSVSALIYKVTNLEKTLSFYEGLGFKVTKNEGQWAIAYVNWFSIEFHLVDNIDDSPKDGPLVLVSVDIDEFYNEVIKAGYTPEGEPQKTINNRREFSLRDPDGYEMVFFEKK